MLISSIINTLTYLKSDLYRCNVSNGKGNIFEIGILRAVRTLVPSIATAALPVEV